MDMNNVNIEEIVKQVLAGMAGTAPAASASAAPAAPAAAPAGAIPKTAHVAVLTEKEHFDIKAVSYTHLKFLHILSSPCNGA